LRRPKARERRSELMWMTGDVEKEIKEVKRRKRKKKKGCSESMKKD